MNLVQIYDMDGQEFGMFLQEKDYELQQLANKCETRALIREADGEGDMTDLYLEELEKEGFIKGS